MAKARGSRVVQGSRPGEVQKPETVTLKVTLPREVARLLKLEAFGRDVSLGLVIAELVRSSPRRFVLVDRAKGSQGSEGQAHGPSQGGPGSRGEAHPLGVVSEAG